MTPRHNKSSITPTRPNNPRNQDLPETTTSEQSKPLHSFKDMKNTPEYKYAACVTRLQDLFKTEQDVEEWLNSYESGLPKTPMQYMEEGKFETVERLIGMIEHGILS
jgi:Protein of unknown function (DUF2384)